MAAAQHIGLDPTVLHSAVRKLRADEPLNVEQRAAVEKRALELLDVRYAPPPAAELGALADSPDEEELFASVVETDADRREGRRGTPWRAFFRDRSLDVPPIGGE